jgi:hypothetical protein
MFGSQSGAVGAGGKVNELREAGVKIKDGMAVVYRGGNVPKETLKKLRYNDYLSATSGMTDATGNAGAGAYGDNVVEIKVKPEYLRVSNGELQYIGPSESIKRGKYPTQIYQAFNDVYGSNYTSKEIDKMPVSEVRNTARMGLSGGFEEFDRLVNIRGSGALPMLGITAGVSGGALTAEELARRKRERDKKILKHIASLR